MSMLLLLLVWEWVWESSRGFESLRESKLQSWSKERAREGEGEQRAEREKKKDTKIERSIFNMGRN